MTTDSAYQKGKGEGAGFVEFARMIERSVALDLRGPHPAVVVSYTPGVPGVSPPTVAVQPSLQTVYVQDDGSELPLPNPPIPAAILGVMATNTHKGPTVPPTPGDSGLLLVSERALDRWRTSAGEPQDPQWSRLHNPTDAFFLPIGSTGANPVQVNPAGLSMGTNTGALLELGEILVEASGNTTIEGPQVRLGRFAAQPAVLGAALQSALTTWTTAVSSAATAHAAAGSTPVSAAVFCTSLGTATATLATALAAILSTKVVIE